MCNQRSHCHPCILFTSNYKTLLLITGSVPLTMERAEVALIIGTLRKPFKVAFMMVVITLGCILHLITGKKFDDSHKLLLLALHGLLSSGLLALVLVVGKPIIRFRAMAKKMTVEAMNHVLHKLAIKLAEVALIIGALTNPIEVVFMVVVMISGCILLLTTGKNFVDGHKVLATELLLALYGVLASGLLALVTMLSEPTTRLGAMMNKMVVEAMNLVLKKVAMVSFISMVVAVTSINFFLTSDGHGLLFATYVLTFFTLLAFSSGILQLAIVRRYAPPTAAAETGVMIV